MEQIGDTGKWLVTTFSGTQHIFNMDDNTYLRIASEDSPSGPFQYDNEPLEIVDMPHPPELDSKFFINLVHPDKQLRVMWRQSSTIKKIEEIV